MATNPFKQAPAAIPSTTQTSNAQHYYDEPPAAPAAPPAAATTTTVYSSYPSTPGSSGSGGSADSNNILKKRATCACSNISIMQLFHEMKQKYPTVPDTVVSELVTQNCHDRPACIGKLEEAVLGTPAQTTYPAQSIHSGSLKRRSGERKFGGNRSDGSNGHSSNSSSSSSRESSVDSSRLLGPAAAAAAGPSDSRFTVAGGVGATAIAARPTTLAVRPTVGTAATGAGCFGAPPAIPMRPNRTAPPCPPSSNGPLAASLITTTTTASSSAEPGGETAVNLQVNVTVSPKAPPTGGPLIGGQRHTSTISLQPEPPYTRELAQVSSTFSGGGGPPAGGPPTGGGGPASGGAVGASGASGNGRSSTSVNLTLRQPTDGRPHTPIHIHASPLRYTAKNFNAQSGIQSKLEVTFRDGFGSFSAVRAQVPGYEPVRRELPSSSSPSPPPSHHQLEREPVGVALPDGHSGWYQSPSPSVAGFPPPLSSSSPLPPHGMLSHAVMQPPSAYRAGPDGRQSMYASSGKLENDGLTKEMRYQNLVVAEMAVSQQLEQKQRLSLEVERKRTQFESICREIFVLQQSLTYIDAELLDREVLLLAAEVEQLQKKVDSCDDAEEARMQAQAAAAAAAGASITDGLSALSVEGGLPLMMATSSSAAGGAAFVMNRPPKPPRPPPPARPPTTQSPSRGSSGSITPGTPLLATSLGASPLPTPSSSSCSPCSTSSSSFASNGHVDPLAAASRLQPESSAAAAAAAVPNQPWTCSLCTFQNHELMPACEVCSLPKASGSSSSSSNSNNNNNRSAPVGSSGTVRGGDVCDGGGIGSRAVGAQLRRQHHLSVDTGVAAAAAAAAAAATAAVVGASVAGPSTAPPYPGLAEMPPPSFSSLAASGQVQPGVHQHQPQQPQPVQAQSQQPNPPPLQNAPYQTSSIEC